jgi:hypothetical protein
MDADGRKPTPSGVEIDMAIAEGWILLGSQLPTPVLYVASAFTIAAGAELFTLPVTVASSGYGTGTTEYAGEVRIRLTTTGQYLKKITDVELDALRDGNAIVPPALPRFFSLYQDGSQVIRGRCWPGAAVAQACDLWATIAPEDLRDYVGTGGAEGYDTSTVGGSRVAAQALVAQVSGELLSRMSDAAAAERGLDKRKAADWQREAYDLLYAEEARQHALKSTGRIQRWVA